MKLRMTMTTKSGWCLALLRDLLPLRRSRLGLRLGFRLNHGHFLFVLVKKHLAARLSHLLLACDSGADFASEIHGRAHLAFTGRSAFPQLLHRLGSLSAEHA